MFIIAGLAYWDAKLISDYLDLRKLKNTYERQSKRYSILTSKLSRTDKLQTGEEVLESLLQTRGHLLETVRFKYSNSEILAFISKQSSGLGLTDVEPTVRNSKLVAEYDGNKWERTVIRLRFRARYHEAARMINLLEQSPYLVDVNRFSINRGEKDPQGPAFVNLILGFYRLL